jgi:hypothetical protein
MHPAFPEKNAVAVATALHAILKSNRAIHFSFARDAAISQKEANIFSSHEKYGFLLRIVDHCG